MESQIDDKLIAPITKIVLPKEQGKCIGIYVKCPYCNKEHKHGGGKSLNELPTMLGLRIAHCNGFKEYIISEQYKEQSQRKSYDPEYIREYHRNYYHRKLKK
jgi:hypothetical protein